VAIAVALGAAIHRIAVRPIVASIDARYAEVSLAHDSPRWAQTLARSAVEQEPSEPYYRALVARAIAAGD
jgi:hypothetical protein